MAELIKVITSKQTSTGETATASERPKDKERGSRSNTVLKSPTYKKVFADSITKKKHCDLQDTRTVVLLHKSTMEPDLEQHKNTDCSEKLTVISSYLSELLHPNRLLAQTLNSSAAPEV